MPLATEVGLGPGGIVLDGDPAPLKGHTPNFRWTSIVAKPLDASGWPTTWYGGRPQPCDIVLDGDPVPPSLKEAQPLIFDWMH